MHLPEPAHALQRIAAALRPGGRICVEELDMRSLGNGLDDEAQSMLARLGGAIDSTGASSAYGPRLSADLRAAGFTNLEAEQRTVETHGGSDLALTWALTLERAAPRVARDAEAQAAIERTAHLLRHTSTRFSDATVWTCRGELPE